jgi:hypothetical protein
LMYTPRHSRRAPHQWHSCAPSPMVFQSRRRCGYAVLLRVRIGWSGARTGDS